MRIIYNFLMLNDLKKRKGGNKVSLRECASANDAFRKLQEVYQDREAALAALASGGKILIGELGADVPEELILAAGAQGFRLWSDVTTGSEYADRYLEYAFDPMIRSQFNTLASGKILDFCSHVVISNSTDALIRTYLYLREMKRTEPDSLLPEITFIDWLFTRRELYRRRNRDTLELFAKTLEDMTGNTITDSSVSEAMRICSMNRSALRRMNELRLSGHILGSEALVMIGAGFFLPKEEHTRLINQVCADAVSWPVSTRCRIFFTGSAQEDTSLYTLLEDLGADVIAEDHDWGSRSFDGCYPDKEPAMQAVVDRYMYRSFSSKKAFVSQRVEELAGQVSFSGAQGVLFYNNKYDEPASWDYPSQKQYFDQKGIPSLSLIKQPYPAALTDDLSDTLTEFIRSCTKGKEV